MNRNKFTKSSLNNYSINEKFIKYNDQFNINNHHAFRDLNNESIDYFGKETPLHLAAITGDLKKLILLKSKNNSLDKKNNMGFTPLHWACLKGQAEVVQFLIENGADTNCITNNKDTTLLLAIKSNSYTCVEKILNNSKAEIVNNHNKQKFNPAHIAASSGNSKIFHLLLKKNCNIFSLNIYNATPLHWACLSEGEKIDSEKRRGKIEIARTIINQLVKKNGDLLSLNQENKIGKTALHWACLSGFEQVVTELLSLGCDINISTTPFSSVYDDLINNVFSKNISLILNHHISNE